jgi:type II secretory pathway component PulF
MRWSRRNKALLLENLEMYVSSGLNLHESITIVCRAFSKKEVDCLKNIKMMIEKGHTLSKSFESNINFSAAILGLIEHGESSGNIGQSLKLACNIIEREDALIKSCMSALAYPIIIAVFAFILTIGLMRGVMPLITPLLKSLNVQLPLITWIVMYIS